MPVAAVAGDDVIVLLEHRHHPRGDGFLTAVEVQKTGHASLEKGLVRMLLEGPDAHHATVET
jgi:hypothetical protein